MDFLESAIEKNLKKIDNNDMNNISMEALAKLTTVKATITEEDKENIEYTLKYCSGDVVTDLETYLNRVFLNDFHKCYFFKFSPDRKNITVTINDKSIVFTLQDIVEQAGIKIKMFFKFKDLKPVGKK